MAAEAEAPLSIALSRRCSFLPRRFQSQFFPKEPLEAVTECSYSLQVAKRLSDLERLKRNPVGIRFADLERIILRAGFVLDRTRGSHYVYVRGNRVLTVVKPHGGRTTCHPQDVRDVIRFLEEET